MRFFSEVAFLILLSYRMTHLAPDDFANGSRMPDPQSYLQVWQKFTGWHVEPGCKIGFALGEIRPIAVALTAIRSAAAPSIHEWNVGWAEMDLFDRRIVAA
jgi:hypothetical protein